MSNLGIMVLSFVNLSRFVDILVAFVKIFTSIKSKEDYTNMDDLSLDSDSLVWRVAFSFNFICQYNPIQYKDYKKLEIQIINLQTCYM